MYRLLLKFNNAFQFPRQDVEWRDETVGHCVENAR